MPKAQISNLISEEKLFFPINSGGRNNKVPALIFSLNFPFENPEIPKSIITIFVFFSSKNKILFGFKSL